MRKKYRDRVSKEGQNLTTHPVLRYFSGFILFIAFVFLAYSNSLNGIWAFDDSLVNQPISVEGLVDKIGVRKITYLSFLINQRINPLEPLNFRLFNIFIHIFNSILLFVIALLTLRISLNKERFVSVGVPVAFISAAIFGLHPLNINAVAYIIQRMASLAAFFVLLSVFFYILASRVSHISAKVSLYLMTILFIIFGILSKENAVMAVPLILLYDYIFLSRYDKRAFMRKLAVIILIGASAFLAASFYIPLYKTAKDVAEIFVRINTPMEYRGWMATDVYWSPIEHILTEFRVISRYLFLFVLPLPRFLVFDMWGYSISKGILNPMTTIFSMAFILTLIAFSILKSRKYPFLSFGILWYFIAVSLESFMAVGSDLYFEHRNYLPLTGLSFGLAAHTASVFRGKVPGKYNFWIIFILLSVILGVATFQRNTIWKNPVTFWKDTVEKVPNNTRANLALANSYFLTADFQSAKNYYHTTVKLAMEGRNSYLVTEALYRLGFMHLLLEQEDENRKVLDAFEEIAPDSYKLKVLKGYYSYLSHDFDSAIRTYQEVLRAPQLINRLDKATLYTLIGEAYRGKGLIDEALNNYKLALNLNHSFPAAYHGMAKAEMLRRDIDAAIRHLRMVIVVDPYNIHALSDLAHFMLIKGEGADKALFFAKRAVSLKPPLYQPYLIMAVIMAVKGKDKDAERFYAMASELNAPVYLLHFNKAWAYSLKGDREKQRYYLAELLKLKETPENIRDMAQKMLQRLNR